MVRYDNEHCILMRRFIRSGFWVSAWLGVALGAGSCRDAAKKPVEAPATNVGGTDIADANAALRRGDYDAAAKAIQHAVDAKADAQTFGRAAYLRWLHGDLDGAITLYKRAIDLGNARDPERLASNFAGLSDVYWSQGNITESMNSGIDSTDALIDYIPGLQNKARAAVGQQHLDKAIYFIGRAIAKREDVKSLLMAADFFELNGQPDESAKRVARAHELIHTDPLAVALYDARHNVRIDEALRLAREEVKKGSTIFAEDVLALALARAGKADEAKAAMARAMRLGTVSPEFLLHQALVYLSANDLPNAREAFQNALRFNRFADPILAAELDAALRKDAL